jgi:hypothetical protein
MLRIPVAAAFGEPPEIKLIVIAQESSPLPAGRPLFGLLHGLCQRTRIRAGQRVEQVLIDLEIEHHVHAIAGVTEILHVGTRQYIGFGEDNGIPDAPLQEFPEEAKHVVLLARFLDVGTLGTDDEWHRIHAKTGNAELNPEAHDLEELSLNRRM